MTQVATTPDQARRLLRAGVDPKTADMSRDFYEHLQATAYKFCLPPFTPAWSLSGLLALIPRHLTGPTGNEYHLELSTLRLHDQWEVQWYSGGNRWSPKYKNGRYVRLWDESPIEACVKAIEWLISSGYKLNYEE